MLYRTHLSLTARHTGLILVGTRSLTHAVRTGEIHGASILRFRRDPFRSVAANAMGAMPPNAMNPWRDAGCWPASRAAASKALALACVRGLKPKVLGAAGQPSIGLTMAAWPAEAAATERRDERLRAA